jgi:hypothetical protein
MLKRLAERRLDSLDVRLTDFPLETVDTCALCGATSGFTILADRDRFGFEIQNYMCSTCGFIFISPRPTSAGYASFYQKHYRRLIDALYGIRFDIGEYTRDQKAFAERLDRVVLGPLIESEVHRSVLDIGGSTGVLGAHFGAKYDMKVTVIDPAPGELEVATGAGHEAFLGVLEDFPAERTFGLVLLVRTLNHLQDVNKALAKIRQLSNDDTLIYVDIDDFLAMCRMRGGSIRAATQIDHCNSTSPQVAEAFFLKHGLVPMLRDFSQPPYVGYVLKRAKQGPLMPGAFSHAADYFAELSRFTADSEASTPSALVKEVRYRLMRLIRRR